MEGPHRDVSLDSACPRAAQRELYEIVDLLLLGASHCLAFVRLWRQQSNGWTE
jgi:hypothetical protein